ncbi:retrovirus-related pol polyprotein from transposon TNT 1-94 [Tanacetum coccineum]
MDHCCYLKKVGSSSIILLLYVDDMLVAGSDVTKIKKLKRKLSQKFKMKDLGPAKQILGMSIIKYKTKMSAFGRPYKLSKKQAPKTEASRPDIAHVVRVVSRFMSIPGREHWEAIKWLLRYLKGTSMATLCFSIKDVVLEEFSYSDYKGCLDSGKSTTGYVFTLGGTAVSWMSRIQKCIAMSTIEAEYIAIAEAECYSSREEFGVSRSNETHQDKISLYLRIGKRRDIIFEEDYYSKEPCRYAHQGGDNGEVEALCSFN